MPNKINVFQRLLLKKRATTPKLPASNELAVFASTDGTLKVVNDAGTVSTIHTVFIKKRTTNLGRTNNTLTADTEIVFEDLPVGSYEMEAFLVFDCSTNGGAKFGSGGLAGATLTIVDYLSEYDQTSLDVWNDTTGDGIQPQELKGLLNVTAAGDWSFAWAQHTTDAVASTLKAGSYVKLTKL